MLNHRRNGDNTFVELKSEQGRVPYPSPEMILALSRRQEFCSISVLLHMAIPIEKRKRLNLHRSLVGLAAVLIVRWAALLGSMPQVVEQETRALVDCRKTQWQTSPTASHHSINSTLHLHDSLLRLFLRTIGQLLRLLCLPVQHLFDLVYCLPSQILSIFTTLLGDLSQLLQLWQDFAPLRYFLQPL
jgi:hypothetical protein